MIKSISKNKEILSNNFVSNEFCCPCCQTSIVDMDMVELLQSARNFIKAPIIVTSGYRCLRENNKVGGVYGSYHTKGKAFDTYSCDFDKMVLAKTYQLLGASGILVYRKMNFVHVDNRFQRCYCYEEPYEYNASWLTISQIMAVQKLLNACAVSTKDINYNCGEVDGVIGKNTIKAFTYFCNHYRYKATREKMLKAMEVI